MTPAVPGPDPGLLLGAVLLKAFSGVPGLAARTCGSGAENPALLAWSALRGTVPA